MKKILLMLLVIPVFLLSGCKEKVNVQEVFDATFEGQNFTAEYIMGTNFTDAVAEGTYYYDGNKRVNIYDDTIAYDFIHTDNLRYELFPLVGEFVAFEVLIEDDPYVIATEMYDDLDKFIEEDGVYVAPDDVEDNYKLKITIIEGKITQMSITIPYNGDNFKFQFIFSEFGTTEFAFPEYEFYNAYFDLIFDYVENGYLYNHTETGFVLASSRVLVYNSEDKTFKITEGTEEILVYPHEQYLVYNGNEYNYKQYVAAVDLPIFGIVQLEALKEFSNAYQETYPNE